MIVLARPFPDYQAWWRRAGHITPDWGRLFFYARGREALLAGLGQLGLRRGDKIIVPAYICDSTIAPLRVAGYEIVFLDIEPDLQFDPVKLGEAIEANKAKALLVVHYFGLPADIGRLMAMCQPLGVKIIEDCSHSFLTQVDGAHIGSRGDAAIFSMRKTLAIPDGGALLLNVPGIDRASFGAQPAAAPPVAGYLATRALEALIAVIGWPNIYSRAVDALKGRLRGRSVDRPVSDILEPRLQAPSRLLAGNLSSEDSLDRVSSQVVANYACLIDRARALGLRPYVQQLPDGCVPQWALLDDPSEQIVPWLREHGIGACRWPWRELPDEVAASPSTYSISHELNRRLALLPVHQSVGPRQMGRILRVLGQCVSQTPRSNNTRSV